MKRWPTRPLGDLVSLEYGKALKAEERCENGRYPVYGSNGIVGSYDEAVVNEPTIVVGRKGAIGEAHLAENGCWPIDTAFYTKFRQSDVITLPFLLLWFRSVDLKSLAITATIPGLNRNTLYEQKVPVPPLAEQERIVKLLDEADELRKLRAQADTRTAALLPALFNEMFGDPLGGQHKWPEVKFEEVTCRITYGFTSPMKHVKSGIPIITCKNVLDGMIDFENVHYADSDEFAALTAKSKPQKNDILITKDGTIGRCAVVDVEFPICINQSVALIRLKLDKVMPVYLTSYIIYPSVKAALNGMGKGQALKHLQITELAKMPIPLPPLSLQKEFAKRVTEIREMEAAQSASRQRIEALFQSLLHRAFNGEL